MLYKRCDMREFDELKMLKEFKAREGWSYDRIARVTGLHNRTIQGWFLGKNKPSPMARKVLRAFLIEHL